MTADALLGERITDKMIARKEGAVGWMVFNNPERRNAVSVAMWQAIPLIIDHFEGDPDIRVIALAGAGGQAFVSGADISEFEQQRASAEAVARYDATSDAAQQRLTSASKPTVAMIDGWCIGGGVAVALACDLRIASARSRFGVPAARLGLGYRLSGIKKLVDVVGPANAKEIFFTARQYDAAEAQAMGLINRAVPDKEFESFVKDYLESMGENAPMTIGSVKRIIHELNKTSDNVDGDLCAKLVQECFDSEDYAEGRRAFMEKRKPSFKGR
jgi:enoyl-CoA hydratase